MDASTSAGIASLIIGGISSIGNAFVQSQAAKAQADYSQGLSRVNSMFSDLAATDAIDRGDFLAKEMRRKGDYHISSLRRKVLDLEGAQKVSYANQGVEVNEGSAAEIRAQTELQGSIEESKIERNTATDILTLKSNAWREAWGLKAQKISYNAAADMAGITGRNASRESLLTGGLNAASYGLRAYGKYKMNAPVVADDESDTGTGFYMPGGR